jgi:hypothetical protein
MAVFAKGPFVGSRYTVVVARMFFKAFFTEVPGQGPSLHLENLPARSLAAFGNQPIFISYGVTKNDVSTHLFEFAQFTNRKHRNTQRVKLQGFSLHDYAGVKAFGQPWDSIWAYQWHTDALGTSVQQVALNFQYIGEIATIF